MSAEHPAQPRKARPARSRRQESRLFQLGDFWLGYEAGSDYLFYYWYDEKTGRTRRKTTGERDLEKAKLWLAHLVLKEPPDEPLSPELVTIAAVRRFYFTHHVLAKRNGLDVVRDKNGPRRAFALLTVYLWRVLKQNDIEGAPKVGHFTLAHQHGFMRWCRDKHSLSGKTISTYLSLIKAGFRFAAVPRLVVDCRDREREVRLLKEPFYVADGEQEVTNVTGLPRSKERDWMPTDAQVAGVLDALRDEDGKQQRAAEREAAFRYAIMALNTWARPEAITELCVSKQVDFGRAIVYMNPPGRIQNKKVRPVIRLTDNLAGWLIYWNLDQPILYYDTTVKAISNRTIKAAAKRAGIDDWDKFTRYTFRHFMATRIRRVPGIKVEREERAQWMGHTDPEHRTTEGFYESFDPDYLENAQRATDAVLRQIDTLAKQSIFAPGAVAGTRFTVIKNETPEPPASEESA